MDWFFWQDIDRDPASNMAIDEMLMPEAARLNKPLLRIYGWDQPAVSIGYIQKYSAAPQEGYAIVRRPTGGGIVFHDVDLTYTVVISSGHWIEKQNRLKSYHTFHKVIIKALANLNIKAKLVDSETKPVDRTTMGCFTSPTRYDVISENQAKVAGAAQRRTKHGILHQGSIVINDISAKKNTLTKSLLETFEQELSINFIDFIPTENFLSSAKNLAEAKYNTESWNKDRKFEIRGLMFANSTPCEKVANHIMEG